MSLRKLLSLLLLVTLSWTSVVPAGATVSINSSVTVPTLAQDPGTAANGANRDVVPLTLRITFSGTDLNFGTSATKIVNGALLSALDNGKVFVSNGVLASFANGSLTTAGETTVAIFTPPTGAKFVKLNAYNSIYQDTTNGGVGFSFRDLGSGPAVFKNVIIDSATKASFPGSGVNGVVLATVVGSSGADTTVFGSGADTEFAEGSLILNFITPVNAPNTLGSGAGGTIVINGIGLAADPGTTLGSSGSVTITYKEPNTSATATEAFSSLADGATYSVATLASNVGKVEFLALGDKTGSETSTTAEPDSQPNTILAALVTGTTLKVAPGFTTQGGSTSYVDTDTLILRSAERADSTASTRTYYDVPFATSAFVTSDGATTAAVLTETADATDLRDVDLESSSTFPNTANALMKITYTLETPTGGSSTATLAIDAVSVSLLGSRAFTGIRNTTAAIGGSTTTLVTTQTAAASALTRAGFLGAAINVENGTTSADVNTERYGIAALYNGTASSTVYKIKDVTVLNYSAQATQVGVAAAGAGINTSFVKSASPTTISNGTAASGIFPGSLVIGNVADGNGTASTWALVNTINGANASGSLFKFSATNSGSFDNGDALVTPGEVTLRFINGTAGASIGNAGWFIFTGSDAVGANTATDATEIGSTNASTNPYDKGWTSKASAGAQTPSARNNAIMVGELSANVLRLLPLINKYDGLRDAIAIRPEATITLDATAKTTGVRLIATATGGNLPTAGVRKVIAEVIPTGGFTAGLDLTSTALPVHGTMSALDLMQEGTTDAGLTRSSVSLEGVTGATTSVNNITDLITTGNSLDTTTPPLFCGGSAGTSSRGPNGSVFQPKARAILLQDNGTTGFENIANLGSNVVIRVTLPTGFDLNAYNGSLAASKIVGITSTGGVTGTITRVQPITSTITNAFVDFTVSHAATTVATKRAVALVFKPNAIVAPTGVTSFAATVTIQNTAGTNTRDGVITDDTLVSTIGTVALATECSTFLTVGFCNDAFSSFQTSGSTATKVEATKVTNGARETDFSGSVSTAKRLINSQSASTQTTLPDLCITEGVADALPLGVANDGVPSAFGEDSTTSIGTGKIHIATSLPVRVLGASDTVGINGSTAAASILTSDSSIAATGAVTRVAGNDGLGNEVSFAVGEGSVSGRERPFEVATRIRVPGLVLDGPAASQNVSDQDFYVWFEATTGSGTYNVGSNLARSTENVNTTTNEHFLSNASSGASEALEMSNFFSDRALDTTTGTMVQTDWGDNDSTTATNDVLVATASTTAAKLTKGAAALLDNVSYDTLSASTPLSIIVSDIASSTNKNAKITAKAASLEPGTTISITSAGSVVDSITVPVLDDGSFQANLRCATGASISITQAPTTNLSSKELQLATVTCDNLNAEPVLVSATSNAISGLTSITGRGKAPVVFTVVSEGLVNGTEFVPTASQLTLGGKAVTAVSGSTTKFIGIVDFSKSSGQTITATVEGEDSSSVALSGFTTQNPTLTGSPVLTSVKVNKGGFLVVKGLRLSNTGIFGFILDDGTFSPADLRKQTSAEKKANSRRSASAATIPTNATHAVFHVPGRGISTIAL